MQQQVLPGINSFLQKSDVYNNIRLALVINNAAKTSTSIASCVSLLQAGFKLVKLFSPEHG